MDTKLTEADQKMLDEMNELGPWHMAISINDRLSSGMTEAKDAEKSLSPSMLDKQDDFKSLISKLYPRGLKGKTFSDHACNAGGYCFWAKDLGAKSTFGYDVRDHWINQARYIVDHREENTKKMRFEVMDLYDLPEKLADDEKFDITWFSGIFYHLPDPVTGLKIAADRTREVLYISTATQNHLDPEPEKGALFSSWEGKNYLMTGVHNLNWFPSGPKCLAHILNYLGFPAMKTVGWNKQVINKRRPGDKSHTVGRIAVVAARDPELLENFEEGNVVDSIELDWNTRGATHNPNPS